MGQWNELRLGNRLWLAEPGDGLEQGMRIGLRLGRSKGRV